jgi:hypothetical protein
VALQPQSSQPCSACAVVEAVGRFAAALMPWPWLGLLAGVPVAAALLRGSDYTYDEDSEFFSEIKASFF